MIILPREARDKHREEGTQKKRCMFFLQRVSAIRAVGPSGVEVDIIGSQGEDVALAFVCSEEDVSVVKGRIEDGGTATLRFQAAAE
jgi:hypothetical protein|eukprot:COSAG06_NODE_31_length_31488_cov_60.882793_10_plen_86_part_00